MSKKETAKKRKHRRKNRKYLALFFAGIIVLGTLVALSLTVLFPIKHIQVGGSNIYTAEQIVSAANIKSNDNLLRVNKKELIKSVQQSLPFIEKVEVKRKLPETLIITVSDATESHCYYVDGKYYSVNTDGRVLKEYTDLPENIALVDCEVTQEEKGVLTYVPTSSEAKAVIDELFLRDLTQNIILVSLKDIHNIEVYLDTDITVKFGDAIYFAEKVDHFVSMNIKEAGTVKLDQWNPQHKQGSFYAK